MNPDELYIRHIIDALAKVTEYTGVVHETFLKDSHWQDAIIRQLEVVGEATKRLSDELRFQYPDVPWRRMAGLRDVLIHDYMGVDIEAVWVVASSLASEMRRRLMEILTEIRS